MKTLSIRLAAAVAALALAAAASAGPPPVVGGPLLDEIAALPAGQWKKVSANLYSDVWTPADLRPLNGLSISPPSKIILAWSSFAWDTRRGDVILYGGGHANYSGNDVYRWRSSSLFWERASLPSEITEIYQSNGYMAIDGPDAAPASAHTYDNNNYLPLADRFLAFGGALYNTGGPYLRPDEVTPGAVRTTGPYLFDPEKADGDKVGGTTGSHVRRVAPYADIVGGNMWQNRDLTHNRPTDAKPTKYTSGCTAYAEEGGYDVVYIGATGGSGTNLDLFRYVLRNVADPTNDGMAKVGQFWYGTSGQTSCGYDASRKLFVRTGNNTYPFIFWSLTAPGPFNRDARVEANASITAFLNWLAANSLKLNDCGLDFDPGDGSYAIWCGGPEVWRLRAPATNVTAGWSISLDPMSGDAPPVGWGTGILGKWKYVPGYDVFVGLEDPVAGNIWIYKPLGWTPPAPGDYVNFAPHATLDSPATGQAFDLGTAITLTATASDSDGSVARVDFYANAKRIGSSASAPFSFAWTPASTGEYVLEARAIDNLGGEGLSPAAIIDVVPPDVLPTVSITSPADGFKYALGGSGVVINATAADSDGTILKVEFLVNGTKIGEDTTAPYSFTWTPVQTGAYAITARAIDNRLGATTSATVNVQVLPPDIAPTVSLTSPRPGDTFPAGTAVSLAATANDTDGSVAKVEFFANSLKIGEAASAPYTLSWTPPSAGGYALVARATDNLGVSTDSTSVSITVTLGTMITLQQDQNGYTAMSDTYLSSYSPTANYGSSTLLYYYGQKYANLLRFAVFAAEGGPVPDGATIVSATVQIYKTVYNYTYELHPMLKAWDEAQATWSIARTGNAWTVPGAQGAGTDYSATPDAAYSAPWNAGWMTFDVTNRVRAIGQGGVNYGWRVVGVSGYNGLIRFYSSEYTTDTSLRPRLAVTYSTQ